MRKLALIAIVFLAFTASAAAQQCPIMPAGLLCITQAAGNNAASNARELAATKDKVAVLEESLRQKDASIEELTKAGAQNNADLVKAVHKTEIELATATGKITEMEADRVRWMAVVDVLIKNSRKKSVGLINLF